MKRAAILPSHDDGIRAIALGPDGTWAVSCDRSGIVRIEDRESGQSTTIIAPDPRTRWQTHCRLVAVSPDGRWLAAGDNVVHLWDRHAHQQVAVLDGFEDTVRALTFSPDGVWLATIDDAGHARVWSTSTNECVAAVRTDGNLAAIAWGAEIVVVGHQGFYGYRFIDGQSAQISSD